MKAGEALVYDHRLLHASGINKTETPRLVIVYGLIPAASTMRYFYTKGDVIEEYECTADFYFNENIIEGPKGLKLLRSVPNQNPEMSLVQLKEMYEPGKSVIDKLLSIFK